MFVTIDPGLDTGWALWDDVGLCGCGIGDPLEHLGLRDVTNVWIEDQIIIPRSKANPNDILKLAQCAGRWAGRFEERGVPWTFVPPNTWKGGPVPKQISHPRIWAALRQPEKLIVDSACSGMAPSKRHNVLDAVGIGLWARKHPIEVPKWSAK